MLAVSETDRELRQHCESESCDWSEPCEFLCILKCVRRDIIFWCTRTTRMHFFGVHGRQAPHFLAFFSDFLTPGRQLMGTLFSTDYSLFSCRVGRPARVVMP